MKLFSLFPLLALVPMALSSVPFDVEGHRGARWVLPENTLEGFRYALDVGVTTLEMDLGVTKDGHVVVKHDPYINPAICLGPDGETLTGKTPLAELTLAAVQAYDCGTLQAPGFPAQKPVPGAKIPTLREVFQMVQDYPGDLSRTVLFNIETKSWADQPDLTPPPEEFARLVYEIVQEFNLLPRVTLQSFDFRTLRAARELDPDWSLAALIAADDRADEVLAKAIDLQPDILSPNHTLLTKERVAAWQEMGFRVIPWTVNQPEDWTRLLTMGVDGIITDRPGDLIEFLETRK